MKKLVYGFGSHQDVLEIYSYQGLNSWKAQKKIAQHKQICLPEKGYQPNYHVTICDWYPAHFC